MLILHIKNNLTLYRIPSMGGRCKGALMWKRYFRLEMFLGVTTYRSICVNWVWCIHVQENVRKGADYFIKISQGTLPYHVLPFKSRNLYNSSYVVEILECKILFKCLHRRWTTYLSWISSRNTCYNQNKTAERMGIYER